MSTQLTRRFQNALSLKRTLGVVAAAAALAVPTLARADDPVTMAPPVDGASASYDNNNFNGASADTSSASSSVFSWQEIPVNQRVPIQRAVFDQGGYQLYDTVGETIAVPFANNNLYVMKFAVSPDGSTYFINDGNAPIMFLPRNAYLENASVNGARWYPFSDDFHPSQPVFLGIAPSYNDYCGMGWYPNMFFYGGYYGESAFGIFTPSFGLFINIGGSPYYGWDGYRSYCGYHPDFYRVGYYHPYVYGYAGRQYWGGRSFRGYGDYAENHGGGYGYNHGGYGESRGGFGGGGFNQGYANGRNFYGAGRAYNTGTRSFGDSQAFGNGRKYGGNEGNNGNRTFEGNGNEAGRRGFGGEAGTRSYNNSASNGNGNYGGTGRAFRGAGGSYGAQNGGRFEGNEQSRNSSGFNNNNSGPERTYNSNGDNNTTYNGNRTYSGQGRTFNGGASGGGFQGETRSYSSSGFGHSYGGNGESTQRTFNGGGGESAQRTFDGGGGASRNYGGGNGGGGGQPSYRGATSGGGGGRSGGNNNGSNGSHR